MDRVCSEVTIQDEDSPGPRRVALLRAAPRPPDRAGHDPVCQLPSGYCHGHSRQRDPVDAQFLPE